MRLMMKKRIKGGAQNSCLGARAVLLSLYLLGYTPFGLLDTFFLRWVAHPQFTESVYQLVIGRVKLQRMEPGLTGVWEVSLLGVNIPEMLIEHRVIPGERNGALHLRQGLG